MAQHHADTLTEIELAVLRRAVRELVAYHFSVGSDKQGNRWGVLKPDKWRVDLLCFSVCRLDRQILIKVETHDSAYHVHWTPNIEDGLAFIRSAIGEAEKASQGVSATVRVVN